jgi:lipopolysaccharide/colanic/teichoic acid biosynthesis glycosyltransferase
MVLDINRCLLYGAIDGALRYDKPKRYYSVIDGEIGMEGVGPMQGNPKECGVFIRFFDILLSSFAIIILFPFMLPIVVLLKLTGEHYVFYKQMRVGRYGEEFPLLKFATMLKDSPNLPGGLYTVENDPRILPLGRFLRKTKINELPQLVNILKGDMSVVGYRPLVRQGYAMYSEEVKRKLYHLRPGLSGMGSIFLRNEEEILHKIESKDDFYRNIIIPYKGKLEGWYVDNQSLLVYFKIIIITVFIVLKPSSHAWQKAFKNLPSVPRELEFYMVKA